MSNKREPSGLGESICRLPTVPIAIDKRPRQLPIRRRRVHERALLHKAGLAGRGALVSGGEKSCISIVGASSSDAGFSRPRSQAQRPGPWRPERHLGLCPSPRPSLPAHSRILPLRRRRQSSTLPYRGTGGQEREQAGRWVVNGCDTSRAVCKCRRMSSRRRMSKRTHLAVSGSEIAAKNHRGDVVQTCC